MNFSDLLRNRIKRSTLEYIADRNIPSDHYEEHKSAIIFKSEDIASNPNFSPKSLENIIKHEVWIERLSKTHSHFNDGTTEMASSNSSDALLMNIFCHPEFFKWTGPQKYLGFENDTPLFGWNPEIELGSRNTEVDMLLGETIYEAKLTESGFTEVEQSKLLVRYPGIEEIFDLEHITSEGIVSHYQLLRNIYAANEKDLSFNLICDTRRPDLIQALFETAKAIKEKKLRDRVGFITWQEIASKVGKELKDFLKLKYGIIS